MKIVLTESLNVPKEKINQLAQPLIDAGHEFTYYPQASPKSSELVRRCNKADIIMLANTPFPVEALDQLEQVKYINIAFTGVDHVPVAEAKERGIQVSNASGYSTTAVAELVLGLALNLYRQLKQSDIDARKTADFPGLITGSEIKGKTLAIIGTGKIGCETARLFKALGADLIAYSRSENPDFIKLGGRYTSLDEALKLADIISLHLPYSEDTHHIIGEDQLALLKDSAILINCARAGVVDTNALCQALTFGKLAGAAVDVFDSEAPLREDHPLLTCQNILLTPHIGYLTHEAMVHRAEIAFDNTHKFLQGKAQNLV